MEDLLAKFDLKQYARRGAEARVSELTAELDSIFSAFPDLRRGRGRGRVAVSGGIASDGAPRRRRRRKPMSASQKRAVSIRMKKYWADRRKAAGK